MCVDGLTNFPMIFCCHHPCPRPYLWNINMSTECVSGRLMMLNSSCICVCVSEFYFCVVVKLSL